MNDDRLKDLFRGLRDQTPGWDFDACWREAETRVGTRKSGIDWRWALGPSLAVSAAAVLMVAKNDSMTGQIITVDAGRTLIA